MKLGWYAIRTKPGAQTMAAAVKDPDFPVHRIGESNVERSLRQEGIDVYMPAHWIEIHNRRTHKITERRLPLLTSYAFVHIDASQFESVRLTDGVLCFLRMSMEVGPHRFPEPEIATLMVDEFLANQKSAYEKHCRDEEARLDRVQELTRSLKKILPKGRAVRINMRAQADIAITKMAAPARERVSRILAELDALTSEPSETRKAA